MVVSQSPAPSPSATSVAGASAGEQAGANAFGSSVAATGGAFSLGSNAYNGASVFYGLRESQGGRGNAREAEGAVRTPVFVTPEQAYQDYYNWTDKQRQNLNVDASGAGLTDQQRFNLKPGTYPAGAIFDSSGRYTRTYKSGEFVINEITGDRSYVGPQFKTVTNTRTDLTDPETAKALTRSIFQQLIGRDPGPGEYGKFGDALKAAEQANPTVENTTQQYDKQGNVIATTTNAVGALRGAVSQQGQQQIMEDLLKQSKEYGVQQATTTYAEATKRAIWGGPAA